MCSSDLRTLNQSHANNEGSVDFNIAKLNGSKSDSAFEIPASILLPKQSEVTNLLVPVCHAASHIAYGATRMEPTFMLLGEVAGHFASFSIRHGHIDVQNVDVKSIQRALEQDGILLHYPPGHCDSSANE